MAVLSGATACGGEDSAAQAGGGLAGEWRSVSVEQRTPPPAPLVAPKQLNLLVLASGRVIASARCNTVSGSFQVEGDRFVMGEPATTMQDCPDRVQHNEDRWLAAFLTSRPTVENTADRLHLTTDATRIVLAPRAVVAPDRPLEGTRWRLTKVTSVDPRRRAPRPVPRPGPTELLFADGIVRGTSGCARSRRRRGSTRDRRVGVDRQPGTCGARTAPTWSPPRGAVRCGVGADPREFAVVDPSLPARADLRGRSDGALFSRPCRRSAGAVIA